MCGVPMHMHSKLGDAYNKHYSGFVYHPEQFRMGANRLQYTDLSPSATCLDQVKMHDLIQERKLPQTRMLHSFKVYSEE